MGLDSVDIVVTIEKRLGITLPACQLEKVLTVGDLQQVAWQNTTAKEGSKCKSQIVFYRLRRHIISTAGTSRQRFTTDASLNNILPAQKRRLVYAALQRGTQLQLPALTLTPGWDAFLGAFGATAILGGFVLSLILINFLNYSKWYLLMPCVGIALIYMLSALLETKRTVIAPPTISDFVKETVMLNYAGLTKKIGTTRKEVDDLVTQIISDISGIEAGEITPPKKMGDDLGID